MNPAIRRNIVLFVLAAAACCFAAAQGDDEEANRLPAGAGKALMVRTCGECHGFDPIRKLRLSRDDWSDKFGEMVMNGARATDEETGIILTYLTENFGTDSKVRMNTAPFGELRAVLKLTNEEGDAIVAYRKQNGAFKGWSDVAKVPGVDPKKIEAAKDQMLF